MHTGELDEEGRAYLMEEYRRICALAAAVRKPLPACPRLTLEQLKAVCPYEMASIAEDSSPEGPVTLRAITLLKPGEEFIPAEVAAARLAPFRERGLLLGAQHWLLLGGMRTHLRLPGATNRALRALLRYGFLSFPGTVVCADGGQVSSYLPKSLGDMDMDGWGQHEGSDDMLNFVAIAEEA